MRAALPQHRRSGVKATGIQQSGRTPAYSALWTVTGTTIPPQPKGRPGRSSKGGCATPEADPEPLTFGPLRDRAAGCFLGKNTFLGDRKPIQQRYSYGAETDTDKPLQSLANNRDAIRKRYSGDTQTDTRPIQQRYKREEGKKGRRKVEGLRPWLSFALGHTKTSGAEAAGWGIRGLTPRSGLDRPNGPYRPPAVVL